MTGEITVNGTPYRFDGDPGYLEGDRGTSFPSRYVWTHCFFPEGSLMISVAEIPFGPIRFTGVICAILWRGAEYRLATYRGAKAERVADGEVIIRQGDLKLTAKLIEQRAFPLNAPTGGAMTRVIRESASCKASYTLERKGELLFSFTSDQASFEFEW